MPDHLDPEQWLARANQAKLDASRMTDPSAKAAMEQVAEIYAQLAVTSAHLRAQREKDGLDASGQPSD